MSLSRTFQPLRLLQNKTRASLFATGAFLFVATHTALSQTSAKPANIDRNGVLILVRSILLALDHANKTGNYTVLRELGSPNFQSNTAAQLGDIFAGLRRSKLDISGVAAIEPQLTLLPQIESNGMLHIMGFFPSIPTQINFDLLFEPVNGTWRLFGVSLGTSSATPAAPKPAEVPAASTQTNKAPATPPKASAR